MKRNSIVLTVALAAIFVLYLGAVSCSQKPQDVTDTTAVDTTVTDTTVVDTTVVEEAYVDVGCLIFARTTTTESFRYDSAYVTALTADSITFNWADTFAAGETGRTYPNTNEYYYAVKTDAAPEMFVAGTPVMIAPNGTSFVWYFGAISAVAETNYVVDYLIPGVPEAKQDTVGLDRLFFAKVME
ncbi:hypothetical protein JXA84_08095 [candidate division WOR-3 bacterium]|nr:hypothetical protein [candidate division WOR-3 bacterium]